MKPLRILLTNIMLSGRTGTEIVTRDLALGLLRRGHLPVVYAPELGPLAHELRNASIPVIDQIDAMTTVPDVIHGHHNATLAVAVARFPCVPAIFVCQGFTPWAESPPHLPSIRRYVAVDLTCADRLSVESGIAPDQVEMFLTAVDLERFAARARPLPDRPARALAYVKHTAHLTAIAAACSARGITLDIAGTVVDRRVDAPEDVFASYDLVFSSALSALEAMTCGCAVIVCDARGLAGLVTPQSFERWRPLNFGLRTLTRRVTESALVDEIDRYDADAAAAVSAAARRTADMSDLVEKYIALYRSCIEAGVPADRAAHDRALARHLETWRPRYGPSWPWMIERSRLVADLDAALGRPPRVRIGEEIALGAGQPPVVEYVNGFSEPEAGGVWTDGEHAMMALRLDAVPGGFVDVALLVDAFLTPEHPSLVVAVRANGVDMGTWAFRHPHQVEWRTVCAPLDSSGSGVLAIDFTIRTPRSPRELGLSIDGRRLGLSLKQLVVRAPCGVEPSCSELPGVDEGSNPCADVVERRRR